MKVVVGTSSVALRSMEAFAVDNVLLGTTYPKATGATPRTGAIPCHCRYHAGTAAGGGTYRYRSGAGTTPVATLRRHPTYEIILYVG
jgi:hypothetical protein